MFRKLYLSSSTWMDRKQMLEAIPNNQSELIFSLQLQLDKMMIRLLKNLQESVRNFKVTSSWKVMSQGVLLIKKFLINSRMKDLEHLLSKRMSWEKELLTLSTHTMRSERRLLRKIQTMCLRSSTTHLCKHSKLVLSKRSQTEGSINGRTDSWLWLTFACFISKKVRNNQESSRSWIISSWSMWLSKKRKNLVAKIS